MTTKFLWYPPSGEAPMEWGPEYPWRLHDFEGLENTLSDLATIKSPSQLGETAVDITVPPRVISVALRDIAESMEDYYEHRRSLIRALTQRIPRGNSLPVLGVLRVLREDLPPLDIDASPRSSPQLSPMSTGFPGALADVELLCPYPYLRDVADSAITLEQDGGLEFPLEFPFESLSNNVEQTIVNEGDVDAPMLVRLYGDVTTVTMTNVTTGEAFRITGQIEADQFIEVDTAFGQKRVELNDTGVVTNAMHRLDLAMAELWSLQPGANLVRFEADINTSGRATVSWRQRYSGI
jgi:hypothetical protein